MSATCSSSPTRGLPDMEVPTTVVGPTSPATPKPIELTLPHLNNDLDNNPTTTPKQANKAVAQHESSAAAGETSPDSASIMLQGETSVLSDAASAISQSTTASSTRTNDSQWRAQIELSLPTQRRLIRKPLPSLPSSGSQIGGGRPRGTRGDEEKEDEDETRHYTLAQLDEQVETWWPETLPDLDTEFNAHAMSDAYESELAARGLGAGLDVVCETHLKDVLLQAWAAADPDADGAEIATTTLPQLYAAVLDACRSLSAPTTMAALQRTAAMKWRAEMQLRASMQAAGSGNGSGNTSRGHGKADGFNPLGFGLASGYGALAAKGWAKLGWPAAALAKASGFALAAGNTGVNGDACDASSKMINSTYDGSKSLQQLTPAPGGGGELFLGEEQQQRIRKRDVAVKILGNALWYAKFYSTNAAIAPENGNHTRATNGAGGAAAADTITRSDTIKANEQAKSAAADAAAAVNASGTGTLATMEERPPAAPTKWKKSERGGLPLFPSKAAPTTAVTSSAEEKAKAEAVIVPTSDSALDKEKDEHQMPEEEQELLQPKTSDADASASEATTTTAANATASGMSTTAETSKAVQQLASLNAAAGAALQAKKRAIGDVDELPGIASLKPTTSDKSLRSLAEDMARHQVKKEAEETASLERAERQYAEKIGKECAEWAKMVVCRTCFDLRVRGEQRSSSRLGGRYGRHGRSGTITAADAEADLSTWKARRRAEQASSASEQTLQLDTAAPTPATITWVPDVFEGDELFATSTGAWNDVETSDRVRCLGGTFKVDVTDEAEGVQILDFLRLAVSYFGTAVKIVPSDNLASAFRFTPAVSCYSRVRFSSMQDLRSQSGRLLRPSRSNRSRSQRLNSSFPSAPLPYTISLLL